MTGEGSLFDVPPAAIGRFRVLHQVGAGACGPVFRAVDPETDAPIAIKLFTIQLPPQRVGEFVEALSGLVARMPPLGSAVTPLAAGLHDLAPYLATSFADGDSLDVALKQFGPAALVDLVPRLRAVAAALDAAASRNILHGALHPRDVTVSESDTVLTGLGVWPLLAQYGERLPIRRPYRAPELGDQVCSAVGDQFSLAALAYEWMTGRRAPSAFVAGDMAPVAGADREALADVFGQALHADPGARFDSCGDFVTALAAVDMTLPDEEVAAPVEPTPRRRARRLAPISLPLQTPVPDRLALDAFPEQGAPGPAARTPPHPDTLHPATRHAETPQAESPQAVTPDAEDPHAGTWYAEDRPAGRGYAEEDEEDLADRRDVDAPYEVGRDDLALRITPPLSARDDDGDADDLRMMPAVPALDDPPAEAPPARVAERPIPAPPPVRPRGEPAFLGTSMPDRRSGFSLASLVVGLLLGLAIGGSAGWFMAGRGLVPAPDAATAPEAPSPTGGGAEPSSPAGAASSPLGGQPAATPDAAPGTPAPEPGGAPAAPSSAAPAGSLLVRSTPTGATVFVDGNRRGITPLTLQDVELGTRSVRVQRDGFVSEERQVALTRARPSRSLDVRLARATPAAGAAAAPPPRAPAARTGTLVIESRPTGAAVLLDGRPVGTTPLTIDDQAPGPHTVQMQLAGFQNLSTTVRVVAGERARVAASLTQEPQ